MMRKARFYLLVTITIFGLLALKLITFGGGNGSKTLDLYKAPTPKLIPKYIFTYWNSDEIPLFVKECVATWRKSNPEFKVEVFSEKTLVEKLATFGMVLPRNFHKVSAPAQADWVRLALLSKEGGIWVDASFIMTDTVQRVINIQEQEGTNGFMFYLDGWTQLPEYKYFESWFIASTPANPTINAWFNEFDYVIKEHAMDDSYLEHLNRTYGADQYNRFVQGNSMPGYLKIHIALQKVMQIDHVPPFSGLDVAEPHIGPLYVTAEFSGWNEEKMARLLLADWPHPAYKENMKSKWLPKVPPFIKVRNWERYWIIKLTDPSTEEGKEAAESKSISLSSIYCTYVHTCLLAVEGSSSGSI